MLTEKESLSHAAAHPHSRSEARERIVKAVLLGLGTLCVVLGLIGVIVPILPTTPFLLVAAACYARSSSRAHRWLLTNRLFGRYIRNYREGKGLPLRMKVGVLTLLWLTIGISAWVFVPVLVGKVLLVLVASGVTIYLLRAPTSR